MNRVTISAGDVFAFVDMDDKADVQAVSSIHEPEEVLKVLNLLAAATIEIMRKADNELDRIMKDGEPPKCVVVLEPEELIALMWAVEAINGKHDPVVMGHARAAYGELVNQHQKWLKLTESDGHARH